MKTTLTCIISILLTVSTHAAEIKGKIVQFLVYAQEQSDITRIFPGSSTDFTWNNVYIVSIWTNDPDTLIPDINKALEENSKTIQILIPPFTIEAATQKWIEYNLVWVLLLIMVFVAGCSCGGLIIKQCLSIKQDHGKYRPCRTQC
jgi:hypothetical protein